MIAVAGAGAGQSKEAIEKPILIWEMEEQGGGREVCAPVPVPASHQEKSK